MRHFKTATSLVKPKRYILLILGFALNGVRSAVRKWLRLLNGRDDNAAVKYAVALPLMAYFIAKVTLIKQNFTNPHMLSLNLH